MIIKDNRMNKMSFICPECNHNKAFHAYIKNNAMEVFVCKIKGCNCVRSIPPMMEYSEKLLEELR